MLDSHVVLWLATDDPALPHSAVEAIMQRPKLVTDDGVLDRYDVPVLRVGAA